LADSGAPRSQADSLTAPSTALSVHLRVSRVQFRDTHLFEDLSLDLPAGRTTCLLGPSGVGKSTVLRLLAGLLPLGPGDRLESGDARPLMGRVAYMDQRDLLLPWLTVVDNVLLGARLRGERRDRQAAEQLLDMVGLRDQAHRSPDTLSGGMRQRVALARTLMEDRPLILMDEPFSALDAVTRFQLQALAAGLFRSRTVLLVTHDPAEAVRLAHRILVLRGQPARLEAPVCPPGAPPRDPTAAAELACEKLLMAQLGMCASPC
jgi:putative hydroxymethylpyrimidine transport system ATP-binding protein